MIYTFRYEGKTPSKKNNKTPMVAGSGKAFLPPNFEYARWLKGAMLTMKLQMAGYTVRWPIPRCKRIYGYIYFPDRRPHDLDNVWTTMMDMVVKAGIIQDDSWQVTGGTMQLPQFREGRPGWDLFIETWEAAPGPAAVHTHHQPPR
jgi:hypothetical protein